MESDRDALDAYAESVTTPMPEALNALAAEARASLEYPQMLTGPVAARFLQTLVFALNARRVLEIGTYAGYSALAMAEGLAPGGMIITCEISDEHADFAQRHIDASPYADRIEIRRGPALDVMRTLEGPFDLVFIDADKDAYRDYFHSALPLLADRGLIVLDNTLRGGRVLDPGDDRIDNYIADLNRDLASDARGVAVLLTVRDGLTIWRRA